MKFHNLGEIPVIMHTHDTVPAPPTAWSIPIAVGKWHRNIDSLGILRIRVANYRRQKVTCQFTLISCAAVRVKPRLFGESNERGGSIWHKREKLIIEILLYNTRRMRERRGIPFSLRSKDCGAGAYQRIHITSGKLYINKTKEQAALQKTSEAGSWSTLGRIARD